MRFKPLVSAEDLMRAEADIAAAENAPEPPARPLTAQAVGESAPDAHLRPEPRFEPLVATVSVRLKAALGMKSALRRIETVNRIARTVELGCSAGLYDPGRTAGGREYALAMRLRSVAADPSTPDEELPVILGWVQALVAMGCRGMTPDRVKAA